MPLPNRVDPFGNLFADASRGLLFGNRGGPFHRDGKTLALDAGSRAVDCCRLDFKGRHRDVWGSGYTGLLFLDEPTALAASHRPCFGAGAPMRGLSRRRSPAACRVRGSEIDHVLHAEPARAPGAQAPAPGARLSSFPDGGVVALADEPGSAWAVPGPVLLRWTSGGYTAAHARPRDLMVNVLTPPAPWPRWRRLSAALASTSADRGGALHARGDGIRGVGAAYGGTCDIS